MIFIRPQVVTDGTFISSTITESEGVPFVFADSYSIGNKVVHKHRVFESKVNGNQSHWPDEAASAYWKDLGSTAMWAMFDGAVSTQTTATGSFTVSVKSDSIDSLAMLKLVGKQVSATLTVDGSPVFSEVFSLDDNREVFDWDTYLWTKPKRRTKLLKLNIPKYTNGILTITVSGLPTETVGCGMLVIGQSLLIGRTKYEPEVGIIDYSKIKFDDFDNGELIKRNWSPTLNLEVLVDNRQSDFIYLQIAEHRATPLLWVGVNEKFESLILYGIYTRFRKVIKYRNTSLYTLELKGML